MSKRGRKPGYRHSEESKNKMSESHFGIRPTDEDRKKRSESMKKMWKNLKDKQKEDRKITDAITDKIKVSAKELAFNAMKDHPAAVNLTEEELLQAFDLYWCEASKDKNNLYYFLENLGFYKYQTNKTEKE